MQIYEQRRLRTGVLRTQPRYYLGLDLGQAQDYSAIVVIERAELRFAERDPVTMSFLEETRFSVRHAERIALGSPYPEVVEHVMRMTKREPLAKWVKVTRALDSDPVAVSKLMMCLAVSSP